MSHQNKSQVVQVHRKSCGKTPLVALVPTTFPILANFHLYFYLILHVDYELEISIAWYSVHVHVADEGATSLWDEERKTDSMHGMKWFYPSWCKTHTYNNCYVQELHVIMQCPRISQSERVFTSASNASEIINNINFLHPIIMTQGHWNVM